ncbi:DUF4932 domain-containing protein [Pedobacter sp. AW31-3R]|uniref:DUF4932 domain-containing protein n=1 Tax=Pedobacter sp. AW31-3R TaxID=3445781 RepID=UPI003FA11754
MKRTILSILLFSASTLLFAQDGQVNFTEKFKKEHQGKHKIEIHELKELIHIMIAITKTGQENDDMVQQKGKYYQDVLTHFKKYENEQIIKTFDSLMIKSPLNYVYLTGNAISYDLKDNQMVASDVYIFPAQQVSSNEAITENPVTTYKKEIEEFAQKSNFREFYSLQKPFYNTLIEDYEKNANVGKQWKWLEKNFKTKVNSYLILCSPLINGLNYTEGYTNNKFKLIQMVLPPLEDNPKRTKKLNDAFNTRGMFTEIDHNYTGTPSEHYEKEINASLANREKWVNPKTEGTQYYSNPKAVFNEYMTYAVFVLYCESIYKDDQELLGQVRDEVNSVMSNQRGFIKMKEFNTYLAGLHQQHKKKKIDDLYPELLEWCAKQ